VYKLPPVNNPLGLELDEKGPHFMRLKRNIAFPPSTNLNVNMMPFIFGDKSSLPNYLHSYFPLTMLCNVKDRKVRLHEKGYVEYEMTVSSEDATGTVCYLTVQESDVEPHCFQRRPGAHTESAGYMKEETGGMLQTDDAQSDSLGQGLSFPLPPFCPNSLHSHCVQTYKCAYYNSASGVCVCVCARARA
jgi:hypothetical protein